MVISLLPYLVAAHELSILELSKRCGVSRPALTALTNNTGKGVQFETLDKLCRFFNVPIQGLLLLINEKTCYVNVLDTSLGEPGRKILVDATIHIGSHDIPAECAVTFDGECGVDAEIRPALNGTTCDDDSFIEAISSCKPACELVRSLLAQSLEHEYAGYDVSAFAWI